MGNCVFRGFGEVEEVIKVVTANGGIMELYAPITAECITNEFPGHALFRTPPPHLFSSPPLLHNEQLHVGMLYYLLPLNNNASTSTCTSQRNYNNNNRISSSTTTTTTTTTSISIGAPYRMSLDNQGGTYNTNSMLKRSDHAEVFPRYNSTATGVWKVKLVISPEQLSEILSQEARTEALIESVRTVAKCGNGVSSLANSDQWSLSSSWKPSSQNCGTDF